MTGEFPGKWDYDTVVDWDPEDDTNGVEEGERGRGYLEGLSHVKVHCVSL